jgi:hypothetical protein
MPNTVGHKETATMTRERRRPEWAATELRKRMGKRRKTATV